MNSGVACFALLDDIASGPGVAASRLYEGLVHRQVCRDADTLDAFWAGVEQDLASGLHVVTTIDYEWGAQLQRATATKAGALTVLSFASVKHLTAQEADTWLANRVDESGVAGFVDWQASVERDEFDAAIARIHALIAAGETYQLNYTFRLDSQAFGDPGRLYRRLRARQTAGYGALIRLPETDEWVLSLSPELFVRHGDGQVEARPMKGTAARGIDADSDRAQVEWLRHDTKNRAENLMIVDLLRNDIGRLAVTGTVEVPALFSIEPYATVHQMTSTVVARLRDEITFPDLLRALFPCGSITGAPKRQTMRRIAELESTPRGLYTGSIGWIDAPAVGQAGRCPPLCLSVAIRTVTLGPEDARGLRAARAGVGGGIVIDSVADDEYEETRLKTNFLRGFDPGFVLIETMRAERESGIAHADRHLRRLARSAARLGFAFDPARIAGTLDAAIDSLAAFTPSRLRLALQVDGTVQLRIEPLTPMAAQSMVIVSDTRLRSDEVALCGFKTSNRSTYDTALTSAIERGAFDALFFNARDELTEGARSNVFVLIEGRWRTPALSCGVLPGIAREVLLDDPALNAVEAVITRAEFERAEALFVCNALRGRVDVPLPARSYS
ncbi:bifunctional anthranilate synthase component I family protein/class IV aminotransferase [soil metagenome]